MKLRMIVRLASRIASEIAEKRADRSLNTTLSQVTPLAFLQKDLECESKIKDIAREFIDWLCRTIDEKLARRMTNRLHFSNAREKVDEVIRELNKKRALKIARKVASNMDFRVCEAICSKVIKKVTD